MAFCSNCGAKLTENAAFCSGCGNKIEAAQPPVQEAPPPPVQEPAPVQEIQEPMQTPDWLNQPEQPAADERPSFIPPPPPPVSAEQTHQAYIVPEKTKQGKSPLAIILIVFLALALFAGGFFGVHFLLPVVLGSGTSFSRDSGGESPRFRNTDGGEIITLDPDEIPRFEITPVPDDLRPAEFPHIDVISNDSGNLIIWSFTDEVEMLSEAFKKAYPNVNIDYVYTPDWDDQFKNNLLNAVFAGNVPDVVSLEASFVREFVENGSLMNLSELKPLADELGQYQFVLDIGTSPDGALRAFSYQACPGGMFYRRSIALDVWGNDDPAFVQSKVYDADAFLAAAKELKAHSPNIFMTGSINEFLRHGFNLRSQPWIVDNKLVIDPKVEALFDLAKAFRNENLEARAGQWSGEWFYSFNSELYDVASNEMRIFSYFLPTWGLPYVIMPTANNTIGDWGLVQGPFPYSWGGTWLGAMNDAPNPENAVKFIEFATLNDNILTDWAMGGLNPDDKYFNPQDDFINSSKVARELVPGFASSPQSDFLCGQNFYEAWAEIAENTQFKWSQRTDWFIQDSFGNAIMRYIEGQLDKEEAIANFRRDVREMLPDLDWQ
ncbi:MAG: extracellular solute-binding protein [Oscillospiraceae bacterium]|nr:extracellular solute-binding protein [Oscillospiraceae bacterium]